MTRIELTEAQLEAKAIYRETTLRGTIQKTTQMPMHSAEGLALVMKLRNSELRFSVSEQELEEWAKDGSHTAEEIENLRKNGGMDYLLEDQNPDVTEVVTDQGIFLLVAQKIDGHGHLWILEEE